MRRSTIPAPISSDFPLPSLPRGTEAMRLEVAGEELVVLSMPLKRPRLPSGLTRAEREVLRLLMKGSKNQEIARARGTAVRTVANQIQAIFKKLGVSSRNQLVSLLSRKRSRS